MRVKHLPASSAKILAQPAKAASKSAGASGQFNNSATAPAPASRVSLNPSIHITEVMEPASCGPNNQTVDTWMGSSARNKRRFSQNQNGNYLSHSSSVREVHEHQLNSQD